MTSVPPTSHNVTARRRRRAQTTAGVVDVRSPLSRRTAIRAVLVLFALWVVWGFAQEAWTASRLAAQAGELRQHNAGLQAQNDSYRRDIATVQSGAAAEEVARSNGYSRPDERVYVVAQPTPAAPAGPAGAAVREASPSFGDAVRGWLARLFRRG